MHRCIVLWEPMDNSAFKLQVRCNLLDKAEELCLFPIIPVAATKGAAGYDLYTQTRAPVVLKPAECTCVSTGVCLEIPQGFYASVHGRSSVFKKGVITHVGTIDSDYRGEIKVMLMNLTSTIVTLDGHNAIAQLIFQPCLSTDIHVVSEPLSSTERQCGGFGSTNIEL